MNLRRLAIPLWCAGVALLALSSAAQQPPEPPPAPPPAPPTDPSPTPPADPSPTPTGGDPILETCNETDQFTFTEIGTIMDATKLGVQVGSPIADHTKVLLPDGRLRMYFQYLAKDHSRGAHYSAVSSDGGVTFTLEAGGRMGENEWADVWWGPHIKARPLSDGRLRIYKGVTSRVDANTGIISYISSDGLNFTKEEGFRITPSAAGLSRLSHLTVVPTADGRYRGYFSNMPSGEFSTLTVKSALSSDLLTWTMDEGVRAGGGAPVPAIADYSAEQPHALQRGDGCVTLFYATTRYQGNKAGGLRYSTSRDGVTFSTLYQLLPYGNGPDIVKSVDGTYLLSYDFGNETDGFSIRIGKLELAQPSVRGAGAIDANGDGVGDIFLYDVSTGAASMVVSTRTGGFTRRSYSWDRGWQVFPAHLNGDRIADFLLYAPASGRWRQAIGGGASFALTDGTWDKHRQVFAADLDNDGLTDALVYDFVSGVWTKCFSDGNGGFSCSSSGAWDPRLELYTGDMNGDGRGDFLLFNRNTGSWRQAFSVRRDDPFDYPTSGTWTIADVRIYPADLNGDRRTDLFLLGATGEYTSALSRPNGDFDLVTGSSRWDTGWSVYPADLDGNRTTDLFLYNRSTGRWTKALSTGSGTFTYVAGQWDPATNEFATGSDIHTTDLDGDGRDDLLLFKSDGRWAQAFASGRDGFRFTAGNWGKGWRVFTRR